jgi:DNA-binding LacI/PurR family transcriptional regulator
MDKITINDVAKAAGVAKSTVSRILNNKSGVNPQTRQKVNGIIEKLNFSPNIIARSLKTNQRKQIALAIDDIRNPYYPEIVWAAEQVAHRYGYRILVVNHYGKESEELAVLEDSNEMHVGGIIFMSLSYPKGLKELIKKSKIPVALIGVFDEDVSADMIYASQNEGNLAMDHLIRIGRARIAYASGPKEMHQGARFEAYVNALSTNLIRFDESLVYIGNDFTLQTGLNAAQYYSTLKERPDAVYAGNDLIAIGLLHGFDELGIRVPEDVALIGIDDIKWCVITKPKISSVSNLSTELARIAVEMLMDRLENGKKDLPFRRVMLEPRLIVRDSSLKLF